MDCSSMPRERLTIIFACRFEKGFDSGVLNACRHNDNPFDIVAKIRHAMQSAHYPGRFAPSPSGPLHAGSLGAAMGSYLEARAPQGRWLLRMKDVEEAPTGQGAAQDIAASLSQLGMHWDGPVLVQSRRQQHYQRACAQLGERVYACGCTRKEIADSRLGIAADGAVIYP